MNPIAHYKPTKSSGHRCADLVRMAERELSAFFNAVTRSFGSEQAKLSAEDWLKKLAEIGTLPATPREWRVITAEALTRLASRVKVSSLPNKQQVA